MIRDSEKQRPHERLEVWRDAMALVESIYRITSPFPDSERYGLTMQLRRAAVSVPSNIAEGAARRSTAEYLRFLSMARGSLAEISTQIEIARRLGHMEAGDITEALLDRTFARLNALIRSIESSPRGVRETHAPYESPIPNPQSHAR
ncbi:four helix bundle protein [Pseudoxanthomonas beigongshangi]